MLDINCPGIDECPPFSFPPFLLHRSRSGEGPTFIEAVTFRQLGHTSSDDPSRYRDEAEVEAWLAKDPIARYRSFLEEMGLWDEDQEEDLLDELGGQIKKAIREAEAAQPVAFDTMITDVFAETDPRLQEHFDEELGG